MAHVPKKFKSLDDGKRGKQKKDFDPEDDVFANPEDTDDNNETEDEESDDGSLGREHYQIMGNSKLRKPEKVKLDEKKYGGQAVSRQNLFQNDDDVDLLAPEGEDEDEDPFATQAKSAIRSENDEDEDEDELSQHNSGSDEGDEDEEIDSDEAFANGDEDVFKSKGFVFRGSGRRLTGSSVASDDGESESDGPEDTDLSQEELMSDEQSSHGTDVGELSGPDSETLNDNEGGNGLENEAMARSRPATFTGSGSANREKLKELIANDAAALASSLSASMSADARKGTAVKSQYQTFDRLLDARIKLQKGLTASNDLSANTTISHAEAQLALQKAEEAALALFSTIESVRHTILNAKVDYETEFNTSQSDNSKAKKRKSPCPPPANSDVTSSELWSRLSDLETTSLSHRRQVLDKWSTKTNTMAPTSSSATRLNGKTSAPPPRLTNILDTYLNSETNKLLPVSSSINLDPENISDNPPTAQQSAYATYDDSFFYQALLRDLIASRSRSSNTNGSFSSSTNNNLNNLPLLPTKLHPSGNTNRRSQKIVDTKASKGRKVRYTVHEKLENFMASDGGARSRDGDGDDYVSRGMTQWNDGAISEFFASLLGQKGMLVENEGQKDDQEMMEIDGMDDEFGGREMEALRLFRS